MSQGLIITPQIITIGYVAKPLNRGDKIGLTGSAIKKEFADRLNQLCNEAGIPPKFKNRQARVGTLFGVSQKGARKWLEAEGLPTFENCIAIALHFKVHVEWLLTGRGPRRAGERLQVVFTRDEVQAARRVAEIASTYGER